MARKRVVAFFGAFVLLAGVLFLLRALSLEAVTGASITDVSAVLLSELRAVHDGEFILVSFVVVGAHPEARIAYVLDAEGESIRSEEVTTILEPGKPEQQAFRIRAPEQEKGELFITLSVDDGTSLAYSRAVVTSGGSGNERAISRSFIPIIGLATVFAFVLAYFVYAENQGKRARVLARHAAENLVFRRSQTPRESAAFK